jgi:hypothetical protein
MFLKYRIDIYVNKQCYRFPCIKILVQRHHYCNSYT